MVPNPNTSIAFNCNGKIIKSRMGWGEPTPTVRAGGEMCGWVSRGVGPPCGGSRFPASSFDFAQDESVLCCMSDALMLSEVEARALAPRPNGGRPRHAPGRRCLAACAPSPIRLIPARAILTSCPHRSRIRCRSGCGVRDRMGFAGGVRSCTALGRSGQGELAKASWESASSGRTGVRPPRMRLLCEKHGGSVRAAPVTKTRDLGPFRGVR